MVKRLIEGCKKHNEHKRIEQETKGPQFINPKNYRIVPCRLYHGPTGCTRGDFCHFIHAVGFECKIINDNMKNVKSPERCSLSTETRT